MLMNLLMVILSIFELIDKTVFLSLYFVFVIFFKHSLKQNHCNFDFFQNIFIADITMSVEFGFFHSINSS